MAHSRGGGEALQRGQVWRLEFSGHYQLRTTEELVKTILSDVTHCVLRKMNGDGPQERRGDLTVERLMRGEEVLLISHNIYRLKLNIGYYVVKICFFFQTIYMSLCIKYKLV